MNARTKVSQLELTKIYETANVLVITRRVGWGVNLHHLKGEMGGIVEDQDLQ